MACFKKDVFLLRSCIASIRFWYPEVEIFLMKDVSKGNFSTKEIEVAFNVKILESEGIYNGWGFAKFEVFSKKLERFLLLDADTVLLGKVIEDLEKFTEDFIVTGVKSSNAESRIIKRDYIDVNKIKEIDPSYKYPGFGINTGQIVISPGLISENDINDLIIKHNGIIQEKYPGVFPHADQGVINYILAKKISDNKVSVKYHQFWIWPGMPETNEIDLDLISNKRGMPSVLHWAGIKPVDFRKFLRYDILQFYNDYYYSRIPLGVIKRVTRFIYHFSIVQLKITKYKLLGIQYS